jgi:Tfp pilus assembly protein PilF
MGWAMLCEARGRIGEAQQAYETAMKVEPLTTGARTNLAALLEREASRARPADAQQMIRQANELRAAELPLLARDASLAPDSADLQYRYGLALYLSGDMEAAMKQLQRAVDLAPEVELFRTARDLLQEKMSQ